jgi:hypothetical protein
MSFSQNVHRLCNAIAAGICGQKSRVYPFLHQFSFCKMIFIHFMRKPGFIPVLSLLEPETSF